MDEQAGLIRRHISFQAVDVATVQSLAKDAGLSFSGGLRVIIRQWVQQERLQALRRAYETGVITSEEALERMAMLAGEG